MTGSVAQVNLFNFKCHKIVQMLESALFLDGCRCIGMHCKINLSLISSLRQEDMFYRVFQIL